MRALHVGVMVVAVACRPVPLQSLDEVTFPPGFEMTTERGVTLTVRAASDYDPSEVFLAVRSTGGRPLYEGTASYALANDLRFTVPATVDAIEVLVRDTAGQHRAKVRLDPSGSAAFLLGRF